MTSATDLGSWASWYATQGVPVFPLRPGSKKPLPGSHGVDDATTDAATITSWWSRHPDANIGAATGVVFDCIDVDGPEGAASLDALYPDGWPATRALVRTPRPGGRHLYVPPMGAPVKAGLRPSVDTRGAGGYVVLPPSTLDEQRDPHGRIEQHAGTYSWEGEQPAFGSADVTVVRAARPWRKLWDSPAPVAAPAAPRAPLAPSQGTTRYGVRVLDAEAATVATAAPGTRNDTLNRAAYKVGQLVPHEVTEADAVAALLDAARGCGLPDAEARATLASGLGDGKQHPRQPDDRPAAAPVAAPRSTAASPTSSPTSTSVEPDEHDHKKQSAAAVLVDLALDRYRFGCTPEGEPFGVPLAGGHVVRLLRGSRTSLRAELASLYRKKTGRIAPQQALADALLVLEGEAQDAEPEPVHLRVAEHRNALWIDLGDAAEHAVKIAGGRWEVVADGVPVLFRRSALTGAMPVPVAGGDLNELWALLNVAEVDRPLVVAWLVAALGAPEVPHPILAVFGEQGTGKSTASKRLVELVDPSPVPLRKPPRDMDSWVTAASGSWVVGLDNLSTVQDWLSDTLCRAATGDGDVRRQLYTDSGLAVFAFRRVILLNGIDLGGLRGDLTERLLAIRLDPIPDGERRAEKALNLAWAEVHPRLLGALLDLVAGMARALPYVRLDTSPRMADFAAVLAALDQMAGTQNGLDRYLEQARSLAADSLTSDPFVMALMNIITAEFMGKASDLLALVATDDRPPRDWPKNARQATTALRRNAPALRRQGWTVDDLGIGNKDKVTLWRIVPPEKVGISSPPPPPNPPTGRSDGSVAGKAGKAGKENEPSKDDSTQLDPDLLDGDGRCRVHHDQPVVGACWTCSQIAGTP